MTEARAYAAVSTGRQVLAVAGSETACQFAWLAEPVSSSPIAPDLDDAAVLTREILSHPRALAEIAAARDEIARGDVVRGTDAVRALRPRR
jgi:hypothetical protein